MVRRHVVGHDKHFLQRVGDRARGAEIDFLLGLYRDHEFVRYLLGELKLPDTVERIARADTGSPPPRGSR